MVNTKYVFKVKVGNHRSFNGKKGGVEKHTSLTGSFQSELPLHTMFKNKFDLIEVIEGDPEPERELVRVPGKLNPKTAIITDDEPEEDEEEFDDEEESPIHVLRKKHSGAGKYDVYRLPAKDAKTAWSKLDLDQLERIADNITKEAANELINS